MAYETELKNPIVYWQYKHSPKYLTLFSGIVERIKKYYPCEIWEMLNIDTATGYALDLIGQRLGYSRPKEIPDTVGQYDISHYAQAYYDSDLSSLSLVKDDTYRYMLKLRLMMWQPWCPISMTSMYEALRYAMPDVDVWLSPRTGQKIMDLFILSPITYPQRRALYSGIIKAPMGQTLIIQDIVDEITYLSADGTEDSLITDGTGKYIATNI